LNGARTIRARVPLRLGLAGGGTDLAPYCDLHGGAVLNTTIDRYAYAFIEPSDDGRLYFSAPDLELAENFTPDSDTLVDDAVLRLHAGVVRGLARRFGARLAPWRITSFVDAPPGSGLGSSSALVVALVAAVASAMALPLGPYDVAHLAYEIERVDLGLAGGKQDQYAATFGGVNFIEFLAGDRVIVNPLRVPQSTLNELQTSLVICFTGVSRRSETIIAEQQRHLIELSSEALESMHQLKDDALAMKDALLRADVPRMAAILNRSWIAKKRTARGISTEGIDKLYDISMAHGALGGKVSGAGGGGFMMFIVPPARRVAVIRALKAEGGDAGGVDLVKEGAEVWTM
jgi:D-glycero-alpha-D-manno-heptose-7-phosphate kinase